MRIRDLFKVKIALFLTVLFLASCTSVQKKQAEVHEKELIWQLPPITSVNSKRNGPKLVNYAHRHDILEHSGISNIEERLGQWEVIILNPDHHLSLDKIRETNPFIKILVWIPLQGPPPFLGPGFQSNWYCKTINGKTVMAPWNQPIANIYADNCGYVYHILRYLEEYHRQRYDGVLYDCMWEYPWEGSDINEDGKLSGKDIEALRFATATLLKETRDLFPEWIVTGNGGCPWSKESEYYKYANGNMHENALGDEFGNPSWNYMWNAYNIVTRKSQKPPYHFINVDVRAKGRSLLEARILPSLTEDDLRRMRLGLVGSMLLDNGYFGFDRGDCLHGQLWWFDEYNVDMGDALGPYSENLYGRRTFSREFENGLVILNNGNRSIHVNPKVNYFDVSTHKEATSFVIPAKDARILLKK